CGSGESCEVRRAEDSLPLCRRPSPHADVSELCAAAGRLDEKSGAVVSAPGLAGAENRSILGTALAVSGGAMARIQTTGPSLVVECSGCRGIVPECDGASPRQF